MTIKQFIEAAIEGGWRKDKNPILEIFPDPNLGPILLVRLQEQNYHIQMEIFELLLDPKAWEAVGKVKGWTERSLYEKHSILNRDNMNKKSVFEEFMNDCAQGNFSAKDRMREMFDQLWKGKSIEEYIVTL